MFCAQRSWSVSNPFLIFSFFPVFALLCWFAASQPLPGSIDVGQFANGLLLLPADLTDEIMANIILDDFSQLYLNTKYRPSAVFPGQSEKVIELVAVGRTAYTKTLVDVFPVIGNRPYFADVGFARLFPGGGVLIGGSVSSPSASLASAFVMLLNQTTGSPIQSFGVNGTVYVGGGFVNSAVYQASFVLLLKKYSRDVVVGTNQWSTRITYTGAVDPTWSSETLPLEGGLTPVPLSSAQCGFSLANNVTLVIGTKFQRTVVTTFNATSNQTVYSYLANYSVVAALFQNERRIDERLFKFSFANGTNISSTAESCVRSPSGAFVISGIADDRFFGAMKLMVVGGAVTVQDSAFSGGVGGPGSSVLSMRTARASPVRLQSYIMPTGSVAMCGVVGSLPFSMQCARILSSGQEDTTWQSNPLAPPVSLEFPFLNGGVVTRDGRLLLTGRGLTPTIQGFSMALVAEPSAVPCDLGPQCMCVGAACLTQGDYVGTSSVATGVVNGSSVVNGNLIGVVGGIVVVQPPPFGGGVVSVGGVVYAGGTLVVQANQSGTFQVIVSTG